jgi:hypothetical protein
MDHGNGGLKRTRPVRWCAIDHFNFHFCRLIVLRKAATALFPKDPEIELSVSVARSQNPVRMVAARRKRLSL